MKPVTILYAIGTGGKAVPLTLYDETPQDARKRLQRNENRRARRANRDPEVVFVWEPLMTDVVGARLLRKLKP